MYFRGQLFHANNALLRQDHTVFDRVLQFANISRPRVVKQLLKSIRRNVRLRLSESLGKFSHELRDQRRYVFLSFPQRWHFDLERVQPVIQIGAQPVLGQRPGNGSISRSNRAEICLHCLRAAERPILPFLKHAQEARLQISGHIRYFVEEQRAAVCRRNHSWKIVHGSGERAFDVPKKFSLDHRLRERRAIELHHRLFSAPAASVNRIGNHLLAYAALSHDENVGI